MRLFKFVGSTSAVLNMARGSLKFTPIEELNDPSELTPVMDRSAVQASLEVLRKNGMTQDQFDWLRRQGAVLDLLSPEEKVLDAPSTLAQANHMLSLSAYENLDYMEKKLFATIKNIRARVGILSLSARCDSLPMWAHYADLARGFVIVLDNLDQSFKGDETGSLNIPKPVVYADQFIGMTFRSYEREWQVVTALNACRRSSDGKLYLRDVDHLHLTGVICGWRARADDVASLGGELKRLNPNAKLISAVLDGGKVSLNPPLQ